MEGQHDDEWYSPDFKGYLSKFEQMYMLNKYDYIDSDIVEYILDHLMISNQLDKATWAAEQALVHFPTNASLLLRYAQILSLTGKLNAALSHLLEIEKLESNNIDVFLTIATCYSQLKNTSLAIRYFQKAYTCSEGEEKAEIAIDLAMEYEQLKDYNSAIRIIKQTIDDGNMNDLLVYELAHCYEKNKAFDKAIQCFLDYIDEEPYSYTTWYNLGNCYAKSNNFKKAIWAFEYAILINDTFIPAFYNLANTYLDNNQVEKALVYFKKCISIDQGDPMVYCSMGECYEELEQYESAYAMFDKSTKIMPQLIEAWIGKGIMSDLMGFHTRAIRELNVAIDLNETKAEAWNAIAKAYGNNFQDDEAFIAFEKALELAPDDDDVIIDFLYFLSEISLDEVFEYVENHPIIMDKSPAQLILCYCHWSIGERSEAMLLFENLIKNNDSIAKDLFLHFPEMSIIPYFNDRIKELEEDNDDEKF